MSDNEYRMPPRKRGKSWAKQEKIPITTGLTNALNNLTQTKSVAGKIEFRLHPKSNRINIRTWSEKCQKWNHWRDSCVHGQIWCVKCERPAGEEAPSFQADSRSVKTEKHKESMKETKRRKIEQSSQQLKETKKEKRQNQIENAIVNGFVDLRSNTQKCVDCGKFKICKTNTLHELKENETFCGSAIKKKEKKIYWIERCSGCLSEHCKKLRADGGNKFKDILVNCVNLHISGPRSKAAEILKRVCERVGLKCHTCGVDCIFKSKSGWRQVSINNLRPELKSQDMPCAEEDLVVSCLACNLFQNKLTFQETTVALLQLCSEPSKPILRALTYTEDQLLRRNYGSEISYKGTGCNYDVAAEVVKIHGLSCVYSKVPLLFERHKAFSFSVDRVDSSQPYTVENARPCAKHINYVKKGAIIENELLDWLRHLKNCKSRFEMILSGFNKK